MQHEVIGISTITELDLARDTVHADTILRDETHHVQVLGWAEDEENPVVLPARILLEFLHEWLPTSSLDEYSIAEISLYPSESPSHKRGSKKLEPQEESLASSFRAWPIPFDGSVAFETHGIAGSHIAIHDMRGVLVKTLTVQKDQTTVYLNAQQLAAGVYFAFLQETGYPTQALKIIKY